MGKTIQEQRAFQMEFIRLVGGPMAVALKGIANVKYGERGGDCVLDMHSIQVRHIELRLIDARDDFPGFEVPLVHVSKWVGNMKDGYDLVPTDTVLKFDDTFKDKFFAALEYGFCLEEVI